MKYELIMSSTIDVRDMDSFFLSPYFSHISRICLGRYGALFFLQGKWVVDTGG